MVDIFNKQQFEAALPKHKTTQEPLWKSLGLDMGEYSYIVPVKPGVAIMIRSSIDSSGVSASTGEDSIRLWLINPDTMQPVGSKVSNYITRVSGWETRLINQLRLLYALAGKVRPCACGKTIQIFKVKKDGPTKGKLFIRCSDFQCKASDFQWLADDFQPKKFRQKK